MPTNQDFANFCCELLGGVGTVRAKRMFGGWGLSIDGLTLAIVADLGAGEKLWLKADAETRGRFEAALCDRFTYDMRAADKTVARSMNYYSAPVDAMDSAHAMLPWARLALDSALTARLAQSQRGAAKPQPRKARRRKSS